MDARTTSHAMHGVMAEFRTPEQLLTAAGKAYEAGYRRLDGFSPFPVHGLAEAIGQTDRKVQRAVLAGGIVGMIGGFGLCVVTATMEVGGIFAGYALNIGGRPLMSWPAFIVPTFETTILVAGITSLVSMLIFNGLPLPYHPVFNVQRFREHASTDGFFLCIEAVDPRFDVKATRGFLEGLGAVEVNDVAN